MNLAYIFSIFFLINSTAFAFEAHTANYQLSINGLKIAEEVRVLHQLEDSYLYTANAKTSGFAAFIKDYTIIASSSFALNEQGVNSTNYKIIEKDGDKIKKNYVVDINSVDNSVTSMLTKNHPAVKTWVAKKGNIVDSLSIFLAIAFDLQNHPEQTKFNYQIADGKKLKHQFFKKTTTQSIEVIGKIFDTIKVEKNDDKENHIQAFFAPEYGYIPVLIKHKKDGKSFTYEINNYKSLKAKHYK
jgi:hypothetical protein